MNNIDDIMFFICENEINRMAIENEIVNIKINTTINNNKYQYLWLLVGDLMLQGRVLSLQEQE